MSTPERRQIPRTAMERLAYIDIEPNNGGIVLNVSDEGLCFHSITPIEKNGPLLFSLLEQNRRIEACGELMWTDEAHKVGGVRFTDLTDEAREQIQSWIKQAAALPEVPKTKTATLGSVLLEAFPTFRVRRSHPELDSSSSPEFTPAFAKSRVRIKLSGYARGLATGLLTSLLCVSLFLLYAQRREMGKGLINLGERLAGERLAGAPPQERPTGDLQATAVPAIKPATEKRSAPPAPRVVPPPKEIASPTRAQTPTNIQTQHPQLTEPPHTAVRAQISAQPNKSLHHPAAVPAKPQSAALTSAQSTNVASHTTNSPVVQAPATSYASSSPALLSPTTQHSSEAAAPTTTASLGTPSSPIPNVAQFKVAPPSPPAPTDTVQVHSTPETSAVTLPQMYFELGKFKDETQAQDLGDRVRHLGLRPSVVQKGHLWMNSFYVLVGPYTDQDEASKTHKDLLSHGYQPRPFERGSRDFTFKSGLTLSGTPLPVGDFTISWESYVTDAKVKFVQGNYVRATVNGQWVKRPVKYRRDEYVYFRSGSGSRLLEIHFSGLDRALVFGS